MVVGEAINNIMGGIESTGGVRLHNHKRKLKQRFDIIKKLGQGTYGKVQLGINKETGQEVAIKTIKKSKIETEADLIRIRREIQIMSSVQHPNIIHIYEVFENREKMVLVMEYAAGGELYDYLSERKVLIEEEARRIFRQISTACYYCHKHKICHRDLKLENILLDENGNAKIADFGLSNVFDDQRLLATFCGSPLYASPEIVKGTPYHGPEVDCWSLGVLLYTLVYGAMPFDGSNFKRLVKQISQGDYFEPKKPSPASPLIREMLTVNPRNRADISKICAHWWVNETYEESCLEISEELANQTPVRLDLLLSLAPPPPQLESEKLVVTGDLPEEHLKEPVGPTRSQSVGSLMELQTPAERRIKDLIADELKASPKRKLETTVSTDQANLLNDGKRKDKIIKENTVADISVHGMQQNELQKDVSMSEPAPLDKSRTQTLSREMDVEPTEEFVDPQLQGAACAEILEEARRNDAKKPLKLKKTTSINQVLEEINENPSQENLPNNLNKENIKEHEKTEEKEQESKVPVKRKTAKKVLGVKNDNTAKKEKSEEPVSLQSVLQTSDAKPQATENKEIENAEAKTEISDDTQPSKPIERRRSRIFEQAEKFQNMISANESKTNVPEKPKKIVIPGVSVGGFKKEFERKASLTSTSPPKVKGVLSKKSFSVDKQKSVDQENKLPERMEDKTPVTSPVPVEDDRKIQLKNAVSIISNALDKEGTRKSKSRPCMSRKPPVPFGASGRSASGSIGMITSPISPSGDDRRLLRLQADSKVDISTPTQVKFDQEPEVENKTSSAEITLKSATLPRRKTTKAEIKLDYPQPKPASMGFKTEMAHHIEAPPKLTTQRSEVIFPVSAAPTLGFRASSVEPEKGKLKERIIPISFDRNAEDKKEALASPPAKPPVARVFQTQKSNTSQRANSLSRQSTLDSDGESNGDPIRKSPREYIIPIAVEGGGYVTPRAGSLEPSDTASTTSTLTNNSRRSNAFGRARRMNSLLSDRDGSEDESPFGSLHRHSSFGKDSDTEDSRKDMFHMHRLRSSRPNKPSLEHNDSVSSGEDDDDDGFEILTAENLFSTLLSRVRDLTQRMNVDTRPGFPTSRLLSHFGHETDFFNNMHTRMNSRTSPLGRAFNRERNTATSSSSFGGAPWRRSVSRDLATDIDRVFKEDSPTPTHTATLPRGDKQTKKENLNLSDLDLKKLKLTDEDALALSYLTPGLSRRIQQQLLAQLPPSEAKKLTRTLSMRTPADKPENSSKLRRRSVDRISSTLPRKLSVDNQTGKSEDIKEEKHIKEIKNIKSRESTPVKNEKSFLPVKSLNCDLNDRSVRSESLRSERESCKPRARAVRSASVREPKSEYLLKTEFNSLKSPDSSLSESCSYKNDDSSSSYKKDDSLSDYSSKYTSLYSSPGSRSSSYSLCTPESSSFNKYVTPKSSEEKKTDTKGSSFTRRVSRFLRPDFFDGHKEENVVQKEKKEREMETQQVLKEIRDKRIKNKLNLRRERSATREGSDAINQTSRKHDKSIEDEKFQKAQNDTKEVSNMLKTVSENIKKLEANVTNSAIYSDSDNKQAIPDYVNVPANREITPLHDYVNVKSVDQPVIKKERVSKLVRPKSYPTDNNKQMNPEKDTKPQISSLKNVPSEKSKEKLKSPEPDLKSNKNKFLQSIEKKLRSFNSMTNGNSEELKEKKSGVKSAISKLREQSLPRNIDHCITESGLIKRAVSVEDVTSMGSKTLQPSRKSVTKILGLFKKYEEREKTTKAKKTKEKESPAKQADSNGIKKGECDGMLKSKMSNNVEKADKKLERPKSLLLDKLKQPQSDLEAKPKSKLPVNSFRRSLNLDNNTKPNDSVICDAKTNGRKDLKLELNNKPTFEHNNENRLSLTTTDDSSLLLSPCDDNISCDSWSVGSDAHRELTSPISLSGHVLYSGDESESVIDRIRRKSFYSRFNEKKKRARKPSLASNYKDLDLYKDISSKPAYKADYGSLDRKSGDYRTASRRASYDSPDPLRKDYKSYLRSSSLMPDVNAPQRYQTYNPRRSKPISSLYGSENKEQHALDEIPTTDKSRKYSYQSLPSRNSTRISISPISDFDTPTSSQNYAGFSATSPKTVNL